MLAPERPALAVGEQPSISNVGRFIADAFVSLAALRAELKSAVPSEAQIDRSYRSFRSLWSRIAHLRVSDASTAERTRSDLHVPILRLLGFDGELVRREISLDPEVVTLFAFGDDAEASLLVDPLPFGKGADDRLERGSFRGTAQRRMVRALAAGGARFGLILGGTRWRLVQLDTANEPRYLEVGLAAIFERDDRDAFGVLATLVSPSFLFGGNPLLAQLVERSDTRGTEVSEALGPATREALRLLLEAVRTDERNAWARAVFVEGPALSAIHVEGIYVLYRLLFVLYAEAAPGRPLPLDKPLYRDTYSLERLRDDLSAEVVFSESSYALWDGVKALFRLIDHGAQTDEFRVPAYNGGLFAAHRTPRLDTAWINDRAFSETLRRLTTVLIGKGKQKTRDRVSFRELGVAQLGAVFEGLLDYEPHIAREELYGIATGTGKQKAVSFLPASALSGVKQVPAAPEVRAGQFYLQAWGGQRKSTGAYYTPQVIADYLVREALRPQVEGKSSAEILEIAVCDPAMGSGGFLVSAVEFLGDAYYQARVREGACDPEDDRADLDRIAAKRIVAERCVYGVDLNPLAVELAKVSLWLTTLSYDRPLSFFDHHLRCGNSLLGAPLRDDAGALTSARLQAIPNEAFAAVDKEAAKADGEALKIVARRNAAELRAAERGGTSLFALDLAGPLHAYAVARAQLSADDPTQSASDALGLARAKEYRLRELTEEPRAPFFRLKEICDLWMAPWFWPHDPQHDAAGNPVGPPTTDEFARIVRDIWERGGPQDERGQRVLDESRRIAGRHRFFHWELEFPEVFGRGGFHAVVGNPPWETLSPETREFFANYDPMFREHAKQRAIERMEELRRTADVDAAFRRYARASYQLAAFLKMAGAYTWYAEGNLGKGDFDLFRSFVERDHRALKRGGYLAQVLKDSVYINSNCTEIRRRLISDGNVRRLIVNENRKLVFPIDSRIKIALLIAERGSRSPVIPVAFFVGKEPDGSERGRSKRELEPILADPEQYAIRIPVELVRALAPETLSIVEVRDRRDVALLEHLVQHGVPFGQAWEPQYCRELDMTNDSRHFVERSKLEAWGATFDGVRWHHAKEGEFWPVVEGKHIYQYEFPVGEFRYWVRASHASRLPQTDGRPVNSYPRLAWRDVASSTNERTVIAAIMPEKTFANNKAKTIRGGVLSPPRLEELCALLNSFAFDFLVRLRGISTITNTVLNETLIPAKLADLAIWHPSRVDIEAAVMMAYALPFELAEHVMAGFPLLDRLQPPLPGEPRSTITRDLVLATYAEILGHPKAGHYRERADRATALGAVPFVPATRAETGDEAEP